MENNGLGFFMEKFVSVYGLCPVCSQPSRKKYSHSNVPVDLVCTNIKNHLNNNKCFLFQTYVIDFRNSFVLVPNYNNTDNAYYYQYLDYKSIYGKDIITWNEFMVSTLPLNRILQTS